MNMTLQYFTLLLLKPYLNLFQHLPTKI
jgi:hypothetical protein